MTHRCLGTEGLHLLLLSAQHLCLPYEELLRLELSLCGLREEDRNPCSTGGHLTQTWPRQHPTSLAALNGSGMDTNPSKANESSLGNFS